MILYRIQKMWAMLIMLYSFVFIPSIVKAEIIIGPVEGRLAPGGDAVVVLKDSLRINAAPQEGGWTKFLLYMILTEYDESVDYRKVPMEPDVKKNAVLRDITGQVVGTAIKDFKTENLGLSRSSIKAGYIVGGGIVLYVPNESIRSDSIVELALERIINTKKGVLHLSSLQKHIDAFGYRHSVWENDFDMYDILDHAVDDPSPESRVVLILHEKILVAVLYQRGLNINTSTPPIEAPKALKLVYIESIDQALQHKLETSFFQKIYRSG